MEFYKNNRIQPITIDFYNCHPANFQNEAPQGTVNVEVKVLLTAQRSQCATQAVIVLKQIAACSRLNQRHGRLARWTNGASNIVTTSVLSGVYIAIVRGR